MTEKQLRKIVLETIQDVLLAEIMALREDMRELRKCSRESLEQVRAMRLEFRQNMEHLNRQLERLARMVEEKLSDAGDQPFFDANKPWMENNWKASAGSGASPNFEQEFSYKEMQTRLRQMESRLSMLEKALQKN